MKVLLVDDEEDFVSALAERLQLRGMDVQFTLDGESALSLIETCLPDVVVLDVMMPGLSGADVLQRIQARHPKMPVLLARPLAKPKRMGRPISRPISTVVKRRL